MLLFLMVKNRLLILTHSKFLLSNNIAPRHLNFRKRLFPKGKAGNNIAPQHLNPRKGLVPKGKASNNIATAALKFSQAPVRGLQ